MGEDKINNRDIISTKEAAEILHISKGYFLRLLREGKLDIPYVKIGEYPKFRRKDVEDYFESHFTDSQNKAFTEQTPKEDQG